MGQHASVRFLTLLSDLDIFEGGCSNLLGECTSLVCSYSWRGAVEPKLRVLSLPSCITSDMPLPLPGPQFPHLM